MFKDTKTKSIPADLSRRRFLQVAGASLVVASGSGVAHFSMTSAHAQGAFKLNILHINDMHSRVESISRFNSTCSVEDEGEGKCFGGFGRLATKIWERRKQISDAGENVITLDAGDQFQGSLFYTTYKGKVEGEFMNKIGFDLMAVGNHEFDNGPDVLADFVDLVEFPVICGNITVADGEKLAGKIQEWAVLEVGGEKIGVLSVLTPDTAIIAAPGPNVSFRDDIEYLKEAVTRIRAQGVNKVLLLSHVGFTRDQEIAAQVEGISAIVGGHSHTLLSNTEEGAPAYATLVQNPAGKAVPIVQAGSYSKHLGDLSLTFDEDGYVAEASGDTVILDASIEPDAEIEARIAELAGPIETMKATEVGVVSAPIDGSRESCRAGECEMGVAVTDAILARTAEMGVTIAIQNGGGLRASIGEGMATVGDVLSVLPFQNTLATMKLKGADIVGSLEAGVSDVENAAGKFPQVAGLKFTVDLNVAPNEGRVKDVMVRDGDRWVAIEHDRIYHVGTNDFMRKGGDGYALFASNAIDPYDYGPGMEEVLAEFIANNAPYKVELGDRITVIPKS
ncbi:bifunctional metallophosphatase/5'-nucleotidase [Aerobium aerolatum]|uniref:5'-nucleotidase n=1 Tax=Aquamicrobium aerolatum DSM 21857 TaxID=1121003 RepID=A0A1I3JTK7_9HYPH|nr:bifunctional metallophosphatase/5'-nucleotidase [Aquamicrobium aerolatum]SFI63543.1 5'-nucleotidase [Aquamicrobium aerolatum DSM 21857]